MTARTKKALLSLGIDSATAQHLIQQGFSAATLKAQSVDSMRALGLSEHQIGNIVASERPPIPEATLSSILFKSKWTCCVCRDSARAVVVHHLVPWSESRSHAEDNLVVLCQAHHDEAHTVRQLSLNLTPERIRDARSRWYAEADASTRDETVRLANMIADNHVLRSPHRGAMAWSGDASIIYGNDGSLGDGLGPPDGRTRRQILNLRTVLRREGIDEIGFAASANETTWVLLAASTDVEFLQAAIWGAFLATLEATT